MRITRIHMLMPQIKYQSRIYIRGIRALIRGLALYKMLFGLDFFEKVCYT
jgi:hypothetical protein